MTLNEYQRLAQRTSTGRGRLVNGALGIAGEAGECADIVKKHLYQGHELDVKHLVEEIGDTLWYCAELAAAVGIDLDDVAELNIAKLMERYPDGFEADRSIHRE